MPNSRLQKDTRLLWTPEATPGVDPGAPVSYIVPLAGESGVSDTQDPARMPIGMGDALSDSLVPGLIQYGGTIPIGLDFDFVGWPTRSMFTGYTSVLSGDGSHVTHEFFEDIATAGARPKTFQLQDEYLESTAKYVRGRYNRLAGLDWRGDFAGGAQYSANVQGIGDIAETDIGGTKTNYGFLAASYFDGRIDYEVGGTVFSLSGQTGINAFACSLTRALQRQDAFFNNGPAAHINPGVLGLTADLGIPSNVGGTGPTADLTMWSDAVNRRPVNLNWVLANGPLLTATAYIRMQITGALVFRSRPKPAPGTGGLSYTARLEISRMAAASMAVAGEYHGPIRGPYTVAAGTAVIGVKIDGGGTVSTSITTGTRTTDEVVTQLNANGAFSAVATADNFMGFVRITSKSKGASSSVQIDTAVANTGHTLYGFNNTARAGRANCQVRMFLYNTQAVSAYA